MSDEEISDTYGVGKHSTVIKNPWENGYYQKGNTN